MTAAADLILTNAEVHSLGEPDETASALAVQDGEIVRVGSVDEVGFLRGIETTVVELDGGVVLPGFIDAHTHLEMTGRYLVHADLRGASRETALEKLTPDNSAGEWILGFGFDESQWEKPRPFTRHELDRVSEEQPVVAFREDMHVAVGNSIVFDEYGDQFPADDIDRENGSPTGVLVEDATEVLHELIAPDRERTRELIQAAQSRAVTQGITTVHDMIRHSPAPAVYRELNLAGELDLRVRLNYWLDHLDAVRETGLRSNHGSDRVETGAIKTYTDGTLGGRTARISEPYADSDGTGQWVVEPSDLKDAVDQAEAAGYQFAAHAIGDVAIDAVLDAYAQTRAESARHRIEHAELLRDDQLQRAAELGVVASVQPNFLKWAGPDGLYDARLGERRRQTNRYRDLLDAGIPLAFGSDSMPLDPLFGIHQTVNAPAPAQQLTVTEALRAYTAGSAYAGFAEETTGTIEPGKRADIIALERSPWDHPGSIADIEVVLTVVDGEIVHTEN